MLSSWPGQHRHDTVDPCMPGALGSGHAASTSLRCGAAEPETLRASGTSLKPSELVAVQSWSGTCRRPPS